MAYGSNVARGANYGRGVVELDFQHMDADEVVQTLLRIFREPGYKPPVLPQVALDVMELSRRRDPDLKKIVDLIEKDALLAAGVMKVARSAVYARPGAPPPATLRDAAVRLGLRGLSDVVLEAAMNARVFRAKGYEWAMDRLRKHSLAVGYVARLISKRINAHAEYAFLGGLLHDIGIAASIIAVADRTKKPIPIEELWKPVMEAHQTAGQELCKMWKLPEQITIVIGHHHEPTIEGKVHPLAALLQIAETIAAAEGFPIDDDRKADVVHACTALGISADLYVECRAEARTVLEQVV